MNNAINVETTVSPLTCQEVRTSEFQKAGTLTAILRQEVKTISTYPGKKFSNELQDNLFDNSAFGDEGQKFTKTEKRVAFMLVPIGTTAEQVNEKLKGQPKACIYKILSSKPIISKDQAYAISMGQTTLEAIASRQRVIDPETGEVILHQGQEQFRGTYFSVSGKEDEDLRVIPAPNFQEQVQFELQSSSFDTE